MWPVTAAEAREQKRRRVDESGGGALKKEVAEGKPLNKKMERYTIGK